MERAFASTAVEAFGDCLAQIGACVLPFLVTAHKVANIFAVIGKCSARNLLLNPCVLIVAMYDFLPHGVVSLLLEAAFSCVLGEECDCGIYISYAKQPGRKGKEVSDMMVFI